MKHDMLADVFSSIKNMEVIGRTHAVVPSSRLSEDVIKIMKDRGYIGDYESLKKEKKFKISLKGKINDCNVIKPRFSVKSGEFFKWEKRFLPAHNLGILIVSTPKGVMDHHAAKETGSGGQLIGFVY